MEFKHIKTKDGENIDNAINKLSNIVAKVGWFENSRYENGEQVAGIAYQNEYGNPSKNIPPRPFMRPTVSNKQNEWKKIIEKYSKEIIKDKITIEQTMMILGDKIAGDIRRTISLLLEPPLSPFTIKKRLSERKNGKKIGNLTKPLIDSGIMISTLTSVVENE